MSLIERIRNKSHEEKVRLIWMIALIAAVVLIILWVLTSKIGEKANKDTTLFKTIGRGVKDIREQYKK